MPYKCMINLILGQFNVMFLDYMNIDAILVRGSDDHSHVDYSQHFFWPKFHVVFPSFLVSKGFGPTVYME